MKAVRRVGESVLLALVALSLTAGGLASGCEQDHHTPCRGAYENILRLAERNHDPDLAARFIAACVEAWDEGRVGCLLTAQSIDEAQACKPGKKRPG